jgi:type IV pilus assembly protein PilY1
MKTKSVAAFMVFLTMLMAGSAHADDTDIFGGGVVNVPPNVLIIFDNSGSMSGNVWVPGSADPYDPAYIYSGTYRLDRVYRYRTWSNSWVEFANIGSDYVVDATEIACEAARNDLNELGTWSGYINTSSPFGCTPTPTSSRVLRTGNYLNYLRLGSGHWEAKLTVAKRTISNLIRTTSGVRFGIMIFRTEDSQDQGGKILAPIATRDTLADKQTLINAINTISAETWTPLAETMAEAGLYFARKQSWFNSGVDYETAYSPAIQYRCQKNFVILMTDGESTQDRDSRLWDTNYINDKPIGDYDNDTSIKTEYQWVDSSGVKHSYGSYGSDYLNDVAKFLHDEDLLGDISDLSGASFNTPGIHQKQNIRTYTIGFDVNHVLLSETADQNHGNGHYFTTSEGLNLEDIFATIIGDIMESNAQFISPVVPVNRLNRTYADNGIYIGLFSPDASTPGLWKGNLKKFGFDKKGIIRDKNGDEATDPTTNQIKDSSYSAWSTVPEGVSEGMAVGVGGAGAVLASASHPARHFYTNTGTTLVTLNATSATTADLGLSTDAERDDLLDFVRGQGIYHPTSGTEGTKRDWILGDIIHSQPAVVYDRAGSKNVLFVGANDGFLHCFVDNDKNTPETIADDEVHEQWAFVPRDLVPKLKYLPSEGMTVEPALGNKEHEYYVDGTPKAYSTGNRTYLAFGLRRGGKNLTTGGELTNQYFILNITDYLTPSFVANISTTILGSEADDERLGQSWGTPHFCSIKTGSGAGDKADVLLLTGGYDTNQDNSDPGTADSKGRALFAVNAASGTRTGLSLNFNHKNFSKMRYSMVDLCSYDEDDDGCEDVIYAPSVGGDLFVFDDASDVTGTKNDGAWTSRLLFSAQNMGGTDKLRKFFYAPSIAQESWGDMVYIASGDREHPMATYGTAYNRFYAIRYSFPATWDNDSPLTDSSLTDVTSSYNPATVSSNGWYFNLNNSGEKAVSSPLVFEKVAYITTFTPQTTVASDPCGLTGAGVARLYAVNYLTGQAVFDFDGDGTPERSVTIGSGIPSEPTLVVTQQGNFIVVGTQEGPFSFDTLSKHGIHRYYWYKQ